MKKKLIVLLALCFALNTVAFAEDVAIEDLNEETVEEVTEIEEITESEEIIEPEFTLIVETVTETEAEELVTDTVVESETVIEETVTDTELVTEPEDEAETLPLEESSEFVTEAASETDETEIPSEEAPSEYETEVVTEEVATEEKIEVEILSAEVDSIIIEDNVSESKQIRIHISGNNLEGRCASIKVSPLNGYNEFIYIKSVELVNLTYEIIEITIPEGISGIYRVDVNVENLKRVTQVVVAGESSDSELKCEANRKNAVITGRSTTTGIKAVMVKIIDSNGKIVYLRQIRTEIDGSYTLNATLPAESVSYVVWVTIEGENGGYVKTLTPIRSSDAKGEYTYTCQAKAGDYEDVLVYAKNISNTNKYTYELDYSKHMDDVELVDICALTKEKEVKKGFCGNERIEIISVSNGKIIFVVNRNIVEGELWSGLLNIIRFKRLSDNDVTFTLRIY